MRRKTLAPIRKLETRLRGVAIVATAVFGLALVVTAAGAAAPVWPMYGHDSSHTGRVGISGTRELTPAWSLALGERVDANGSPVVGPDGSIYVTTETKFFAVNSDGSQRCSRTLSGNVAAAAVSGDGLAVYVPDTLGLHKLNPTTCATVWDFAARITLSSPTIAADGSIYFGSAPLTGNSHLYALNPDMSVKCDWNSGSTGSIESSPALGPNGEVYLQHNSLGVVSLDSACVLDWNRVGVGEVSNTPSVGPGGTIYIGDADGLYALDPATGDTEFGWPAAVGAGMWFGSASIADGGFQLYRGDTGGTFHSFEHTGFNDCSYATGSGGIYAAAALTHDVVFFTTVNPGGSLYALRASDCTLVDKYPIGQSGAGPAVGADGTVYALGSDSSNKGVLYAFPVPEPPPPVADFDGDKHTDYSVWRPQDGTWYAFGSAPQQWGVSTDVPVPGDYDGNDHDDFAVWRPETGTWYVFGGVTQQWGVSTDVPVPGDYDGDGDDDIAVWRPSSGTWYVFGSAPQQWGVSTDIPVPADYNGDGKTDLAVWRPSSGTWYVHGGLTEQWGASGDIPVPGQYDFDHDTDIAVWRPQGGIWYVHGSPPEQWGTEGDLPVPGDYRGTGETQIAVWRPSSGTWYVPGFGPQQWGIATDKPLPPLPSVALLLYP